MEPTATSSKMILGAITSAATKNPIFDENSPTKREAESIGLSPIIKDIELGELCSSGAPLHEKANGTELSTRSRTYLRHSCAFSEDDFVLLHSQLKGDLDHPSNLIGLAGPQKGKESFESWLIDYMNSGIGVTYWGADKGRIWDHSTDEGKEKIRIFLRQLVKFAGSELRKKRRRTSMIVENAASGTPQETRLAPTKLGRPDHHEDPIQKVNISEVQRKKARLRGGTPAVKKSVKGFKSVKSVRSVKSVKSVQSVWDGDIPDNSTNSLTDIDGNDVVVDYPHEDRPYTF